MSSADVIPEEVSTRAAQTLSGEFRAVVAHLRDRGLCDPEIKLLVLGGLHDFEVELRASGRALLPRATMMDVVGRALDLVLSEPWVIGPPTLQR